MGGSNAVFSYSPPQAGTWSRHNVAAYGDLEVTDPGGAWTLGAAVRIEDFEDFGTTTNGKVSGRVGFVRGSVSTGFRAPTPGQQHGLHIQSWFDPTVGDLVNNAVSRRSRRWRCCAAVRRSGPRNRGCEGAQHGHRQSGLRPSRPGPIQGAPFHHGVAAHP